MRSVTSLPPRAQCYAVWPCYCLYLPCLRHIYRDVWNVEVSGQARVRMHSRDKHGDSQGNYCTDICISCLFPCCASSQMYYDSIRVAEDESRRAWMRRAARGALHIALLVIAMCALRRPTQGREESRCHSGAGGQDSEGRAAREFEARSRASGHAGWRRGRRGPQPGRGSAASQRRWCVVPHPSSSQLETLIVAGRGRRSVRGGGGSQRSTRSASRGSARSSAKRGPANRPGRSSSSSSSGGSSCSSA